MCTLSGVYVRIQGFKISTNRLKHGDPDAKQGWDDDRDTKKNSQKKQAQAVETKTETRQNMLTA